ncbi:UDP-glycosyltransferase 72E1 [Lathyrus oleraceus]|uniref:UDP-glycosyltransferase 72E1 n=1 Tax=Pisum sativum TaxID=3888 RepID=UPI0021D07D57|nr:UDP-glycosyltransferase 72E1-like [Pisum sativum]
MVTTKTHAVLLASPGVGHLTPTVELGKRLTTHHGFDVTIFVVMATTDSSDTIKSSLLQQTSNINGLNIIVTPPVDVSDKIDPSDSPLSARIILTMIESLPFIRSEILSMKFPPSVLIVDIFGTTALPMARDLDMSTYVFITSNAWFSAVFMYLPLITNEAFSIHVNNHEPLLIPGCEPVRFEDTLFDSPWGPTHDGFVNNAKNILSVDGILMNTWQDLEPVATKAVTDKEILGRFAKGPVYPVGPLVRTVEPEEKRESENENLILDWLDRQPAESVIFLSFGSGGTLSEVQTRELAYGLELSQQRFVWVVRRPSEDDACAAFFDETKGGGGSTVLDYLPEGFLSRTKEVGICIPGWAPQSEILKHPATGGFVTHCGWNSVLESILSGVPMVTWPLYAEQKMNATLLSEELGVAVRATVAEGGVVFREQIAKQIRRVMVDEEGIAMRIKVKEYKVSGEKALSLFGSSHESLSKMAKECQVRNA